MTQDATSIVPVRQADVHFYGEVLIAMLASDDQLYIPLPQMCRSLSLEVTAQTRRIRRTEALQEGLISLRVAAPDGKSYQTLCLRVDLVPGWLAGATTAKIQDETLRKKMVVFQRDLYRVAWQVFGPMKASVVPTAEVEAMAQRMGVIVNRLEAIDEALGMLRRALDEQSGKTKDLSVLFTGLTTEVGALRTELADLQTRSANAFKVVGDKFHRLELRLNPGAPITQEQAARIQEAVAYIAQAMEQRGVKKAYAQVWLQFKTVFSLTEYKALPQSRFSEALEWLDGKRQAVLTDDRKIGS